VYDVDGRRMEGRADVHAMVCESLVLIRDGDGYRVWRATAHHFVLRRIDDHWQIATRTSRVLDGNPDAHALLTKGLAGAP
jgi:hypothetical protein